MPRLASFPEMVVRPAIPGSTATPASSGAATRLAARGRQSGGDAPRKRRSRRRAAASGQPVREDPAAVEPSGTIKQGSRVVVTLALIARRPGLNVGELLRAAWAPGVTAVIADMSAVVTWDLPGLRRLLGVHRDLVVRSAELRLVVWTADLYAALQATGVSAEVPIYANLDAALNAASKLPPGGL